MKLILKIFAGLFLFLVGWFVWAGFVTRYDYVEQNSGISDIVLFNEPNFKLSLGVRSQKGHRITPSNDVTVVILSGRPFNNLTINSATVTVANLGTGDEFNLEDVTAMDGFHSWVEEKNGNAATFEQLPNELRTVYNSIEAYYVYNWRFSVPSDTNPLRIKVIVNMQVECAGKQHELTKAFSFELTSELEFQNPIRVH